MRQRDQSAPKCAACTRAFSHCCTRGGSQVAGCKLRPQRNGEVAGCRKTRTGTSGCRFQVPRDRSGFREELLDAPCSRSSTVRFATGPKRSMGHLLGGEKNNFFNSRYCRSRHDGRADGILSICSAEVSLRARSSCAPRVVVWPRVSASILTTRSHPTARGRATWSSGFLCLWRTGPRGSSPCLSSFRLPFYGIFRRCCCCWVYKCELSRTYHTSSTTGGLNHRSPRSPFVG